MASWQMMKCRFKADHETKSNWRCIGGGSAEVHCVISPKY